MEVHGQISGRKGRKEARQRLYQAVEGKKTTQVEGQRMAGDEVAILIEEMKESFFEEVPIEVRPERSIGDSQVAIWETGLASAKGLRQSLQGAFEEYQEANRAGVEGGRESREEGRDQMP